MTITSLQETVHQRRLRAEKADRFLQSNLFVEAYSILSSSPTLMAELTKLIDGFDADMIRTMCEDAIAREIGEYSIAELRKLARKMCIPYYTSLTKSELLSVIVQRKQNVNVN